MQKTGLTGLILALCMIGCKDNALPTQQLTNIPVVRNTEEAGKTAQNNSDNSSDPNKTTTYTSSVAPKLEKSSQKCKWYIIVASYRNDEKRRAEKLVKGLKAEGYPAEIIETKGRLRISIEYHFSEEKAYERRAEFLKIQGFEGTWILKHCVSTE